MPNLPPGLQPLEYRTPADEAIRPGLLTALAIVGIVVGAISALVSALTVFGTVVGWAIRGAGMGSAMSAPIAAPTATAPIVVTTTTTTSGALSSYSTTVSASSPVATPFTNSRILWSFLVNGIESLISLGLAILLIVAAIRLLRQAHSAHTLFRLYIWGKIPLVIAASVTSLISSYFLLGGSGRASMWGNSNAVMWVFYVVGAAITAAISLSYPIAAALILRAGFACRYFERLDFASRPPESAKAETIPTA